MLPISTTHQYNHDGSESESEPYNLGRHDGANMLRIYRRIPYTEMRRLAVLNGKAIYGDAGGHLPGVPLATVYYNFYHYIAGWLDVWELEQSEQHYFACVCTYCQQRSEIYMREETL